MLRTARNVRNRRHTARARSWVWARRVKRKRKKKRQKSKEKFSEGKGEMGENVGDHIHQGRGRRRKHRSGVRLKPLVTPGLDWTNIAIKRILLRSICYISSLLQLEGPLLVLFVLPN
ncbi:hypothetical protein I7I50_01402 [Histoplasma capsulatum G186AR]|uniref:Uncharacterized protein n=1 Tax=Ajellomyces capsulatus TaxID=5037 RepID=A0A8H8CTA7_AJECA|nr:hypothetical protein I7I52_12518 [Histoplasma capsulatum]QSS73292.1 hypothetical protein I7I50_01402 [Histoplasma capsulatum G186AR]